MIFSLYEPLNPSYLSVSCVLRITVNINIIITTSSSYTYIKSLSLSLGLSLYLHLSFSQAILFISYHYLYLKKKKKYTIQKISAVSFPPPPLLFLSVALHLHTQHFCRPISTSSPLFLTRLIIFLFPPTTQKNSDFTSVFLSSSYYYSGALCEPLSV